MPIRYLDLLCTSTRLFCVRPARVTTYNCCWFLFCSVDSTLIAAVPLLCLFAIITFSLHWKVVRALRCRLTCTIHSHVSDGKRYECERSHVCVGVNMLCILRQTSNIQSIEALASFCVKNAQFFFRRF